MPDLDEKVGGIDRKWWYVIGAGAAVVGYLLYRWYQNNKSNTSLVATTPAATTTGDTGSGGGSIGSITSTTPTISTLSDWMSQAQTWLDSSLNADPATAQQALQNYSNGTCLDSTQYAYIDKALGQLGMPPNAPYQGLIKCPNAPAPPAPVPVKSFWSAFTKITSAAQQASVLKAGFDVLNVGGILYYYPHQTKNSTGTLPGGQLQYAATAMEQSTLRSHGYTLYNIGGALFFNPKQRVKVPVSVPVK